MKRSMSCAAFVTALWILFPVLSAHAQLAPTATPPTVDANADLAALQARLKGQSPITWLFTGDSVTEGAKWVGARRSYSEIFSERVRWEINRGRDIVMNTAISGNKTDNILSDFDWRVGHLHPDVVSLMIGMNDCTRGQAGEPMFEANLRELISRIRGIGAIPILHTTNTTLPDAHRADLPAYNAIIKKVAASEKVILVDNWQYWQQNRTAANLSEWLGNPIHPNGLGHAKIAQEMFRTIGIYDLNSPMCNLGK